MARYTDLACLFLRVESHTVNMYASPLSACNDSGCVPVKDDHLTVSLIGHDDDDLVLITRKVKIDNDLLLLVLISSLGRSCSGLGSVDRSCYCVIRVEIHACTVNDGVASSFGQLRDVVHLLSNVDGLVEIIN